MKLGLGESYDKVEYLPVKLRAYIDLTKPASSVGAGAFGFLASVFYFAYVTPTPLAVEVQEKLFSILYVSFTFYLAHAGSQVMNMAEDAEMDRQTPHKQNRPIPSGVVSEEEARSLSWVLSSFALARGFMVNWRFGVMVMILLGFGIFYNLEPLRVKERMAAVPWQAVSRGLLPFPTIWAAYGDISSITPWVLGIFLFYYVLGFQNSADIIDKETDEKFGVSTFVVMFGVRGTAKIASFCMASMVITIIDVVLFGVLPPEYLLMLVIIPFCSVMLYYMRQHPEMVDERTGNHPSWVWFYVGLVLIVIIPVVIELFI